ncbi:major facilitator superfamily MFS_1 [Methanohalobium evestigatum Z-7303]|uniref:Major facilitator superfamily MFS_1 n=1 Tax=Methanohalobium evestigatum (strain ATCC BAA-1072 / DSM 3721 / NBRC 107634 / OCM 161 / Z-7303) TaxID=644295 RepID=D7E774_METEZ|nr:MFS transporter [Methanohalobium evestigatum]ADI73823.1 major facilitator superfamily MFS_1 [Methanohalobium evestigatum Z-7303]
MLGRRGSGISLLPLLMVNFIGTLGFSIVLPFLVFLVDRFGGNSIIYGIIGATYPVFQLVGAPVLGRWSDIYGRKKILFLSQLGTLLSWFIFLIALLIPITTLMEIDNNILGSFNLTVPLLILFVARALDGITGGNVSVANAYLADITSEEDRSKNYGWMSVTTNLGLIVGPALASILSAISYQYLSPVFAAIIISFIGTLVILFIVPESRKCVYQFEDKTNLKDVFGYEQRECGVYSSGGEKVEKIGFKRILKINHIPYVLLLYFLIFLGFNIFYTAFPLHALNLLEWQVSDMGLYFTVLSSMMMFVEGPVFSNAAKVYSDSFLVVIGSFVLGINFLLLVTGSEILTYIAAIFFAVGNGLMWPSVLSILSKFAGPKYQGAVQGFAGSFMSLASIAGLIFGGFLYGYLSTGTFFISAVIIYIVFVLSFRLLGFKKS